MHSYLSLDAYKNSSLTRLIFSSGIFLTIDGSLCNKTPEGSHCWTLPPYTHPVKIQPHALICQVGHSDARRGWYRSESSWENTEGEVQK